MQRRFNKQNMPNDPQRTGVQGAAQTTPSLTRRVLSASRRSSSRSLGQHREQHGRCSEVDETVQNRYPVADKRPNSDPQARLLSRRKQYSQSKVPTIALDEPDLSTSSPNIPVQHSQQTMVQRFRFPNKPEAHSLTTSPLCSTSPKGTNLSPVDTSRTDLGSTTQRALSASPSKVAVAQSGVIARPRPRLINSSGSMDSVGQSRSISYYYPGKSGFLTTNHGPVARSPLCTQSDSVFQPATPRTMQSISPAALSPSSAHSTTMSPSSLVQQRSTESHESSVSMPSATSSGSGGFLFALGRVKSGRLGSKDLNRSTENQSGMEQPENATSRADTHPLQRRSSYDMATGKLEQPQRKPKRTSWKHAYKVLKEKRDALFGRNGKNVDDSNELSDPVYHLLRCAATPDHQPSTCKCICHMDDFGSNPNLMDISSPINVLFSPAAKSRPPGQPHPPHKHRFAQSKLPSSLPTLYPDEENSPLPEPHWHMHQHSEKKSHFSLPNILHRRRGMHLKKTQSGPKEIEPKTQSFQSPQHSGYVGHAQSRNPVFTFD